MTSRSGVREALLVALALTAAGCPPGPYSKGYAGTSDAERKLSKEARRDVYPDDVRGRPEQYKKARLAWPGIVQSVRPDERDPQLAEVLIAHHYWDWIEDHSIQRAKAFLSAKGEGDFVCHAERRTIPTTDLYQAMTIAYVRPVGVKDGILHAACMLRFFPRDWYATDVFEYGRDGKGFKILRIPME